MELFKSKFEGVLSISTSLYTIVLTLLAIVLIIVKTLGRNPIHVKFASLLKGPTAVPIFGNSLQFLVAGTGEPTKLSSYWRKKYGSIYRVWFGNQLFIVISDVDYIKDILNNKNVMWVGPFMEEAHYFLFGIKGPEKNRWKMLRSLRSHFSPGTVKSLVPKLNKRVEQLIDCLQEKSGSEFDVLDTIFDTVFDMFTSTQFDYVMDPESKKRFDFRSRIVKIMTIVFGLPLFLPGMSTKFARYLTEYIFVKPLRKSYHSFARMMTNEKISSIRNDAGKSTNLEHHKLSYLWSLYERNHLMLNTDVTNKNDEPTPDLSGGFIFAGVEITYAMIPYALLMIAMHSSVQDKLYEEIYEVFGDDQRQADYEDIGRLSYMDRVISETIRRFLPQIMIRHVSKDTRIGPYIFPQGTHLLIDGSGVNFDAKLYPRPLEFDPDNFNEEIVAKRSPYSFLGFGLGLRPCIGETLARTEIKLVLVEILRKFIVRTSLQMDNIKYYTVPGGERVNRYLMSFVPRQSTDKIKRHT